MSLLFLAIYPYIHMVWEGWLFAFSLMYALKQISVHSPLLQMAGVQLQYIDLEDLERKSEPFSLENKRCVLAAIETCISHI